MGHVWCDADGASPEWPLSTTNPVMMYCTRAGPAGSVHGDTRILLIAGADRSAGSEHVCGEAKISRDHSAECRAS